MGDVLKALSSEGIAGSELTVVSQGWQPARLQILPSHRIKHLLANARFEARWKWYTRPAGFSGEIVSIGRSLIAFSMSLAKSLFLWKASKSSATKTIQLTRKHNAAWSQFLESESDFLLVLEDDALLLDGWEAKWVHAQRLMYSNKASGKLFISLGKGFGFDQLGTLHLAKLIEDVDGFIEMSKPFANTACAYLINRELAEALVTYSSSWPSRMLLNADFFLNDLMSRLANSSNQTEITCLHSTNPVFDNASLAGEYSSSLGA
jgi:hypothetical protein